MRAMDLAVIVVIGGDAGCGFGNIEAALGLADRASWIHGGWFSFA